MVRSRRTATFDTESSRFALISSITLSDFEKKDEEEDGEDLTVNSAAPSSDRKQSILVVSVVDGNWPLNLVKVNRPFGGEKAM